MEQTVAIVVNGEIHSFDEIKSAIVRHTRIIAIDGGLVHCAKMGLCPSLIVGDFDSCPKEILQQYEDVPKIKLQKEKDHTDLEMAIQEIGPKQITLYGAWGGRIDHSLTHILLLVRYPGMKIETENEILFSFDKRVQIHCYPGQTLSLIPIYGPVSGIYTKGLKWELKDGTLDRNFIGISNIALQEQIDICIESGSLVCSLIKEGSH